MEEVIEGILGPVEAKKMQPDRVRLCWESMASDENWFVTPHSECDGLYVSTADTGHAWKFLPVIGEPIADILFEPEEFKDNELSQLWAWDRKLADNPDEYVIPQRYLADLT